MNTLDKTTFALLRLSFVPGLGPRRIGALLERFDSPVAVLAASKKELESIDGIGSITAAKAIAGFRESLSLAKHAAAQAADLGATIIGRGQPGYPILLNQIPDPPTVLYVRGTLAPASHDRYPVAMVGSRACSTYGIEQAERFAGVLASHGLTIVSGGARGIDSASHRGALRAKGRTIAVLGCGLAHCYPPENRDLFDAICADDNGAVISELPMDVAPDAKNFPGRNRIISGLALGVIVLEAARGSGALITARCAVEDQGREVFALPGRADSPASQGSNALIKDCQAALVTSPADVIEALETPARHHFMGTHEARYADPTRMDPATDASLWNESQAASMIEAKPHQAEPQTEPKAEAKDKTESTPTRPDSSSAAPVSNTAKTLENRILETLDTARSIDDLAARLTTGVPAIRTAITMLEIKGLVHRQGAKIERRR